MPVLELQYNFKKGSNLCCYRELGSSSFIFAKLVSCSFFFQIMCSKLKDYPFEIRLANFTFRLQFSASQTPIVRFSNRYPLIFP